MKFVLPLLMLAFYTHAFIFMDSATDKKTSFLTEMMMRFEPDTPEPVKHVDSPQCDNDYEVKTTCVFSGDTSSCCKKIFLFGDDEVCMNCTNLTDPEFGYCVVSNNGEVAVEGNLTAVDQSTYDLCANATSPSLSYSFCAIIECVEGNSQCARYSLDNMSTVAGMVIHFDLFYGCYEL